METNGTSDHGNEIEILLQDIPYDLTVTDDPEIWPFPAPLPNEVERIMPGEEAVNGVFLNFFKSGEQPPHWSILRARGIVNKIRKENFHLFSKGYYQKYPELLER